MIEILVACGIMVLMTGTMFTLVGAALRSKLITNARSADTETARQTLEWMSERLRNAGLNVQPTDAIQATYPSRCWDRVVAQDATLRPTASAVYVSGEILNTNWVAADQVITLGYRLGPDPVTGTQVVVEYQNPCLGGAATTQPLSDPRVTVTALTLNYYSSSGLEITNLTDPAQIRRIQMIRISITVQAIRGTSGAQVQTFTRDVMLRNPEPYTNNWKNPNEAYP